MWTYETACTLGIEQDIDPNLPWNEYFEWFGPRYRLEVPENNLADLNAKDGSLDVIRCACIYIYIASMSAGAWRVACSHGTPIQRKVLAVPVRAQPRAVRVRPCFLSVSFPPVLR